MTNYSKHNSEISTLSNRLSFLLVVDKQDLAMAIVQAEIGNLLQNKIFTVWEGIINI